MSISPFRDYARYLKVYRKYTGWHIFALFGLAVLTSLLDGVGIVMLLPLLDSAGLAGGGAANNVISEILGRVGIPLSQGPLLMVIAGLFIAKGAIKFSAGAYEGYVNAFLSERLKMKLWDLYGNISYSYLASNNIGHFMNVMIGQTRQFAGSFIRFVAFNAVIASTCIYLMLALLLDWRFTVLALLIGLATLMALRRISEYSNKLSRAASQEKSMLGKLIIQSMQSLKYLIATNSVSRVRPHIRDSIRKLTEFSFRLAVAGSFSRAIVEPVAVTMLIAILAYHLFVLQSAIAPIIVVLLLFYRALSSLLRTQTSWQGVMDKIGGLEMTDAEFMNVQENQERSGSRKVGPSRSLKLESAFFSYGGTRDGGFALRDINLEITANSTVAFVGASGAGKSTLIGLLTLMLRPTRGHLTIDGVDSGQIDLPYWRSQIGYVSQETVVFDDTVASNISLWDGEYGDPAYKERIHRAAREANCHDFIMGLPDGYETVVGDRGVRLSGGQRQRLFIARELYKEPKLLLLDEATSALDSEAERFIKESIDRVRGSLTVVIVAHRLSTIRNADVIYVLRDGQITECGSYEELTASRSSAFSRMVELQEL